MRIFSTYKLILYGTINKEEARVVYYPEANNRVTRSLYVQKSDQTILEESKEMSTEEAQKEFNGKYYDSEGNIHFGY